MRVLVVPSPLLGGAVYAPLTAALRAGGHDVRTADVTVGREPSPSALAGRLCDQAEGTDLVVAHSNAGRFGPAMVARSGAVAVYVDARLPEVADPPAYADFVRGLVADDGLLPRWTEWWPPADIAEAVPADLLAVLRRTQPRLHPGFLLEDPPPVAGWREQPAAYLAFGTTYAAELEVARAAGWPTRVLEGTHLHLLDHPDEVAQVVVTLAGSAGA